MFDNMKCYILNRNYPSSRELFMHERSILFTETRAQNIITAVEEAITSFTGKPTTGQLSVGIMCESNGSLFIDIEQDDANEFVGTLRKKLSELVQSGEFYKEGSILADTIVGSTYAVLLSLSGNRSDTTSFTLDRAGRAARVERHMQPVRKRIHELLKTV